MTRSLISKHDPLKKVAALCSLLFILGSAGAAAQTPTPTPKSAEVLRLEEVFNGPGIAGYYEELFLYDRDNLSLSDAPELLDVPQPAPPGAPAPPGMLRVPWDDIFSDD